MSTAVDSPFRTIYSILLPQNNDDDIMAQYVFTQVNLLTLHLHDSTRVASTKTGSSGAVGSSVAAGSFRLLSDFEYAIIYDSLLVLYELFNQHRAKHGTCSWPKGGTVIEGIANGVKLALAYNFLFPLFRHFSFK